MVAATEFWLPLGWFPEYVAADQINAPINNDYNRGRRSELADPTRARPSEPLAKLGQTRPVWRNHLITGCSLW